MSRCPPPCQKQHSNRRIAPVLQGSLYGDSQLIRLHPEAVDPAQPSNFVEVMDEWTNLGPIIDLAVVDLERQGQGQVVTCSGKGLDSSLRIVRNGIGMIEQAAVELAGQCFSSFAGILNQRRCSFAQPRRYQQVRCKLNEDALKGLCNLFSIVSKPCNQAWCILPTAVLGRSVL